MYTFRFEKSHPDRVSRAPARLRTYDEVCPATQGCLILPSPSPALPPNTLVHNHQRIPLVVFLPPLNPTKMKGAFAAASIALAAVILSEVSGVHAVYDLVRTWQGQSFFDGWDFYGSYDNLTNVSPPWSRSASGTEPNAGRCDLGKPIPRHHRPPGIRGRQRKGRS